MAVDERAGGLVCPEDEMRRQWAASVPAQFQPGVSRGVRDGGAVNSDLFYLLPAIKGGEINCSGVICRSAEYVVIRACKAFNVPVQAVTGYAVSLGVQQARMTVIWVLRHGLKWSVEEIADAVKRSVTTVRNVLCAMMVTPDVEVSVVAQAISLEMLHFEMAARRHRCPVTDKLDGYLLVHRVLRDVSQSYPRLPNVNAEIARMERIMAALLRGYHWTVDEIALARNETRKLIGERLRAFDQKGTDEDREIYLKVVALIECERAKNRKSDKGTLGGKCG